MSVKTRETITCPHDHADCPYVGRAVRVPETLGRRRFKQRGEDKLLQFIKEQPKPVPRIIIKENFSYRSRQLTELLTSMMEKGEIELVEIRINNRGPALRHYKYKGGKENATI